MKKQIFTLLIALFSLSTFAQVSINTDGVDPDGSSMLDIKSTDKGVLIPRMDSAQRVAITTPATGLLVYQTNGSDGFYYFNGSIWESLNSGVSNWAVNGNDIINANSGNVGIGTTAPAKLLDVNGDALINGLTVGIGNGDESTNTAVGSSALSSNLTGAYGNTAIGSETLLSNTDGYGNTGLGQNALQSNTDGYQNTGIGMTALQNNNGSYNTAIGSESLFYNTGNENTAVGAGALFGNDYGGQNTAIGFYSLYSMSAGYSNTATGYYALSFNQTGSYNTANGYFANGNNQTGSDNTAMGYNALLLNGTGNANTAIGDSALLSNTTGNYNTALGFRADVITGVLTNATAIGYNARVGTSNSMVLGGTGADAVMVGIGTTTPSQTLEVIGTTKTDNLQVTAGATAGYVLQSDASGNATWVAPSAGTETDPQVNSTSDNYVPKWNGTELVDGVIFDNDSVGIGTDAPEKLLHVNGEALINGDAFINGLTIGHGNGNNTDNTAVGTYALGLNTTGAVNTAIGKDALHSNTEGSGNTAIGLNTLYENTTGNRNTASGLSALISNTTGSWNTANGESALYENTEGDENTAMGSGALQSNTIGYGNTAVGSGTLATNTDGSSNTASGTYALYYNSLGNSNTAVGFSALESNIDGSSNTAIGDSALFSNTTGTGNTVIGNFADVTAGNLTNATAIGYNAKVGASNSMVLGGTGVDAVKVGIGTSSPDASALLDLNSTNQGLLPPRMTEAQRNTIATPAAGLIVWCTNCGANGELQVYNGIAWTNISGAAAPVVPNASVTICTQEWMLKSLDVEVYRNGDTIPQVIDHDAWNALTTGAWCYYNNVIGYGPVYGKLYNWYAVNDPRGLAPEGCHIPTDAEWTTLETCLGGAAVAGGAMKEAGNAIWSFPNSGATNSSGFTCLPGGVRSTGYDFEAFNTAAGFWSATEDTSDPTLAWANVVSYNSAGAQIFTWTKKNGLSVRCLKD